MKINRDEYGRFTCDYVFTDEQLQYLKDIAKGHTIYEIADMINKKFDTSYSASQIKDFKKKYKIKSGYIAKVNSGCFEKGHHTWNKKKIGSEVDKSGYTWIKIAEPNVWVQKQRYIYEKKYGEIPDGYKVIFLNQNKKDFKIKNLALVKDIDHNMCAGKKMYYKDKHLTKISLITAELINKTKEVKRLYE